MKSVLLSVKPKYCALIANGKKTIEVRKTEPKIKPPFKCYIYCSQSRPYLVYGSEFDGHSFIDKYTFATGRTKEEIEKIWGLMNGKVIGEFVCDYINESHIDDYDFSKYDFSDDELKETGIPYEDIWLYSNGSTLYLWHISDLVIYDEPKELSKFHKYCNNECSKCSFAEEYETSSAVAPWTYKTKYACLISERRILKRPPQSWCYVEAYS